MKKILINVEEKFLAPLLNNSPLIDNKIYNPRLKETIIVSLKNYGITIFDKQAINENDAKAFDYIIIDDLNYFHPNNINVIYCFIEPIDFNIADPFITDRWPEAKFDSIYANKVEWCNSRFPNLIFLGSNIFNSPNQIFDLSLVLNMNNHNDNWGLYHYISRDLFKAVRRKNFRLDYTFREVKKENRVELFLKMTQHLRKEENIKISAHGGFFNDEIYYKDVRDFFEKGNRLSTFLEFEKVEKKFFSFDELRNPIAGYSIWPVNKLFLNTFSSDIAIYFETAREQPGILNTMNQLITEKTIDLLNIGKPFIHLSSNVTIFLEKFGFKDYKKEVFDSISDDVICLSHEICQMDMIRYEKLIKKLEPLIEYNLKRIDRYYKENTFLNNLIHN